MVLLEARAVRLGRLGSQRRVLLGQPDPRAAQRPRPLRRRDRRCSSGSAGRTSTRSRKPCTVTASTATGSAPASSTVATAQWQLDELSELPELAGPIRRPRGAARPRRGAGARSLADLPRGCLRRRQHRHGRPGAARVGAARAPACDSGCGSTRARPVHRLRRSSHRRRRAPHDVRRRVCTSRRTRRPVRSRRLLRRLGNYLVPVYDYAMMTEPLTDGQRASIGWQRPAGHR